MDKEHKKLTEFTQESGEENRDSKSCAEKSKDGENNSKNKGSDTKEADNSTICDHYFEAYKEYKNELDELGITPPKCGHCIEYLCKEVSPGTAGSYNGPLRMFVEDLHQQGICISDAEYIDVRDFFELRSKRGLSTSTFNVYRSAIKGVVSRYEAENRKFPIVSWKITNNIDPADYGGGTTFEREPLDNEEIKTLLRTLTDFRDKLMILTAIETGPREEATRLIEVSDVDVENKTIELKNTKSGGEYVLPLTDDLAALLGHWINEIRSSYVQDENNPYLFPSRDGGEMSGSSYRSIVDSAAKKSDLQKEIAKIRLTERQKEALNTNKEYRVKKRVDVHILRHTFSRLLKNSGISK